MLSQGPKLRSHTDAAARQRKLLPSQMSSQVEDAPKARESASAPGRLESGLEKAINWRRMLLLIIAITIHNIPGEIGGGGGGGGGEEMMAGAEKIQSILHTYP